MKHNQYTFLFTIMLLLFCACDKEIEPVEETPTGIIKGFVQHHGESIPESIVYIKYNSVEFPGTDVSLYDDQITSTNTDAYFSFSELAAGSYFLYGVGFDDACSCEVIGGIPITLENDTMILATYLPVTE